MSSTRQNSEKIIDALEIKLLAEKIKEKFHPEKIILFGSYAYGYPERLCHNSKFAFFEKIYSTDDVKKLFFLGKYPEKYRVFDIFTPLFKRRCNCWTACREDE